MRAAHVEPARPEGRGDGTFMRGVEVGVQETDGDRIRVRYDRERGDVERFELSASVVEAASDLEAP